MQAESRGACWARRQAQGVYGGEDFLLQIDSHMRAVENWDELLVKTWKECSDAVPFSVFTRTAFNSRAVCRHQPCR